MKKPFSVFLVFVSIITLFVACSPNPEPNANIINTPENVVNDKSLTLITNLGEDGTPQSKGIGNLKKAPDIIGVLLKFHGEGLYNSSNSAFKNHYNFKKNEFDNPRAFYLEYLDTIGTNGDGMKFNYVLYVPQIIRTVYEEGNGVNPKSGNPFWWYMSTYYGEDINSIRNNWKPVLEQLLKHKVSLSLPKAEDVKGFWKADYVDIENTSYNKVKLANNIGVYYFEESNRNVGIESDHIVYFENPKYSQKAKYGDATKQIFVPSDLKAIYFSGSGESSLVSALLWYLETYYHKDNETVIKAYEEGKFGELLESCYNQYGYPSPKGSDVNQVLKTYEVKCDHVSSNYRLWDSYFYDSDILTLNGQPVYNKDRVYYSIVGDRITMFFPAKYVEQLKNVADKLNEMMSFDGDFVWRFANWFCTEEEIGETSVDNDFKVSAAVINKLLDYRVSTGLPEMVN